MSTDATSEPILPAKTRRVSYLRIALPGDHAFNGCLITNTAKRLLPAIIRSLRSKYAPHVGKKQIAKSSH